MKTKTKTAQRTVQTIRRILREFFWRGVDAKADQLADERLVWIVDDIFAGRIKSREEAAKAIGIALDEVFGGGL